MRTDPNYPLRWPQYLPYPQPLHRIRGRVPNASSVDWPQAQFAPPFLPPGSRSFQPYYYPHYKVIPGLGSNVYNQDHYGAARFQEVDKRAVLLPFVLGLIVGMLASKTPSRIVT